MRCHIQECNESLGSLRPGKMPFYGFEAESSTARELLGWSNALSKRHPRVDERCGAGDRMPPGRDVLMKQWPGMNHVWPYLQCDRHVGDPSDIGETDRVVEQCLCRTHLNQEWRQPVET